MEEKKLSFIEQVLGDEGMKFDITANLSPEIYVKLFVTIVGAVIVSALAINLVTGVIKN